MTNPATPSVSTIAIVTGASRGAGRGIAIALGGHGCTVYVTGRLEKSGDHPLPDTIHETRMQWRSAKTLQHCDRLAALIRIRKG